MKESAKRMKLHSTDQAAAIIGTVPPSSSSSEFTPSTNLSSIIPQSTNLLLSGPALSKPHSTPISSASLNQDQVNLAYEFLTNVGFHLPPQTQIQTVGFNSPASAANPLLQSANATPSTGPTLISLPTSRASSSATAVKETCHEHERVESDVSTVDDDEFDESEPVSAETADLTTKRKRSQTSACAHSCLDSNAKAMQPVRFNDVESSILNNPKFPIPSGWECRIHEQTKFLLVKMDELRKYLGVTETDWFLITSIIVKKSGYKEKTNLSAEEVSFKDRLLSFSNGSQYSNREDFFLLLCILFPDPSTYAKCIFNRLSARSRSSIESAFKRLVKFN